MTNLNPAESGESSEPGSRGRIGLIQPAPGLMLEYEWARVLPTGVMAPVTRLVLEGGQPAHYEAMALAAPAAAETLANARADVVAYACGVGSMHRGPEAEAALMAQLSRAADRPVVGMGQAAVQAMRHLGASRIVLITPYGPAVNALVTDYLSASGIAVLATHGFPVPDAVAAARLSADDVAQACMDALEATPDADLLWSACSNVRSFDVLAGVERRTGRAMLSSNQALLWHCLGRIGVGGPDPYGGRLDLSM